MQNYKHNTRRKTFDVIGAHMEWNKYRGLLEAVLTTQTTNISTFNVCVKCVMCSVPMIVQFHTIILLILEESMESNTNYS